MVTAHAPLAHMAPNLTRRLWSEDLPRQHGFEPLAVEGRMPDGLRGTLYRNGPGLFGQGARRYAHPFEADGAVTAIRFGAGGVTGASQVTESAGLVEERAAGKLLYGMSVPWARRMANGLRGRQKNTANTSVVMWQGRLFALVESSKPTELDPRDLSMIGETDLGVVVSAFSAHPHRVEARRALYNFGIEYGRHTRLHLYELPDAGAARHLGAVELAGPPMLHDFIATETYLVFFLSPVRIDLPRMLLQRGTFEQMFRWRPELGTEIICVPIDAPHAPIRFTTEAFYQWHFGNAFARGGELVVDYVRHPNFDSFHEFAADGTPSLDVSRLHRGVIDLGAKTLRSEPVVDRGCEFPTIAPGRGGAETGTVYVAIDDLRGLASVRGGQAATYVGPDTQRVTEPVFVPRDGATRDDDGWLVALCHDGPTSRAFVAVFDAARLPDGPIARAWFDHHVPITFHGTFARAAR